FLDRLLESGALCAIGLEQAAELTPVIAGSKYKQLAGNELIAALLRQLVRHIKQFMEVVAEEYFAGRSLYFGNPIESPGKIRAQFRHLGAGLLQKGPCGAALLVEQCRHEMHGLDVLIVATHGQ